MDGNFPGLSNRLHNPESPIPETVSETTVPQADPQSP